MHHFSRSKVANNLHGLQPHAHTLAVKLVFGAPGSLWLVPCTSPGMNAAVCAPVCATLVVVAITEPATHSITGHDPDAAL